jgi:hypothetical protein
MSTTTAPAAVVRMEQQPYFKDGGTHRCVDTLRVIGTGYLPELGSRFGLGFVPEGKAARREQGGADVPGPWASAFGLAVCIDNFGGSGAEAASREAAGLEHTVSIGDVIEVEGVAFLVDFYRRGSYVDRHNVELRPVEAVR